MLLRELFLILSRNQSWQGRIASLPAVRRMACRFVAGETLDDALTVVQRLNERGLVATINHLGENVNSEAAASVSAEAYLAALDAIAVLNLKSHISVKPTHLGLDLGDELCYANLERVVAHATTRGNFVWIDMEGSAYTQSTIDLYRRLRRAHENVGLAIQAYLYRSRADVENLIEEGIAHLRLCKGAYDEPPSIAYPDKRDVDENLFQLTRTMLQPAARARGAYPAIATHDERIIRRVRAYAYHRRIPPDAYEFQMLHGVRRELQWRLADEGYQVRVYVPYGSHWYPYFMRRLAERPANVLFFLRALFSQ
ncbi:MAG: proline dehydrogenase family protein [Anaerolineae bacterium]|nr:proline dehydrogenase family protein [Anaerolineae bacterium]MDW8100607.1 proline dehydrogenase family protein [Anaerolineae bacterium]